MKKIDELKLAELLADIQTDYVNIYGADGEILYESPSMVRLYGSEYTDGRTLADSDSLLHPDDRSRGREQFEKLVKHGGHDQGEFRQMLPSGEIRWIDVHASAIASADGQTEKVVIVSRDITERKLAEQALAESQAQYRLLADNQSDYVQLFNVDGAVLYDSPSVISLFGSTYAEKRVVGDGSSLIHPDDQAQGYRQFERLVTLGGAEQSEYRWLLPSGEVRWVDVRVSAITGGDGQTERVLAVSRDITERKAMEEKLELRKVQQMDALSQLAAGIAHDFNNTLTVILGGSETIQRNAADQTLVQRWARAIQTASERASVITRHLLAFGRRQVITTQLLDLHQVLGDAETMLSRVLPETIQIETRVAPGPLSLRADPSQLNQVILNLALNARDAIGENGILTLTASDVELQAREAGRRGLAPGSYVILEVIDTGRGMPSEIAERAFEPFFTTKEVDAGLGLGLAAVYGITKQLGGISEIESEPGTGTVVRLYFPRIEGSVAAEPCAPVERTLAGGSEAILVVEDEPMVRDFVCEVLQDEGYRVVSASDGEEALRILETKPEPPFDLLLSDMVMPKLGGHELAERAKAQQPDIGIILMTGYSKTGRPQVLSTGDPIHHLDKPFLPRALLTLVRQALD